MADVSENWLEAQLLRQMAQVKAPESLWAQIQSERRAQRAQPGRVWMLWPVVATILLVATCDLAWEMRRARGSMSSLSANTPVSARPLLYDRTRLGQMVVAAKLDPACGRCHAEGHGLL